jgi:transposase
MHIERVPNRNSPPAILVRRSYREDGKVKKQTLANISKLPPGAIELLAAYFKGLPVTADLESAFDIVRSRPHGHVAAVLGTIRHLGLPRTIARETSRQRDLVVAMIADRILNPRSKLGTARAMSSESLDSTLGEMLELQSADEDDLYAAMDWLGEQQDAIEQRLARKHLSEGALVLYDLTSTYFHGRTCPIAHKGHSRDHRAGSLQIVFGLLCNEQGCPVAVEVFDGNVNDTTTFKAQVDKVRERFGIERVVWVGDRGTITDVRIREDLSREDNIDWIAALRARQIGPLIDAGILQLSLFDEQDLAEISSPEYPGERLIACRNPFLAQERANTRETLLAKAAEKLNKIVAATQRPTQTLKGISKITERVDKAIGHGSVRKHLRIDITDTGLSYELDQASIAADAALDGIYVIRTSIPAEAISAEDAVLAYKHLSRVERAFRCIKTVDLKVRPIYHRREKRVRAHVFLCVLAYYVEWHMRQLLAPILFDDHDPHAAQKRGESLIRGTHRSEAADKKARTKRTEDDFPVHDFRSLLANLATITKNSIQPRCDNAPTFDRTTLPTEFQQRALDLLGVSL